MAETDPASGDKTMVVLSWGMSDALQACLGKFGPGSGRVIWVDPISGADLPQPLIQARPLERLEAVLFDGKAEVDLREYSLPGLCSVTEPAGKLLSLLPGLKARGHHTVPACSSDQLGKTLKASGGWFDILIDTPGREAATLDMLEQSDLMDRIDIIVLRAGIEAYFEGAATAQELSARLEAACMTASSVDDDDPDWPIMTFQMDRRARRLNAMSTKISELQGAMEQQAETAASEAASLRADIEARTKERDAERAAVTEGDERAAKLRADLEARTKERDAAKAAVAEGEETSAKLRADLEARTKERDAARAAVTEGEEKAAKLRADLEARTKERDAAKAAVAEGEETSAKLRADLEARIKERDAPKVAIAGGEEKAAKLRADLEARTKERDAAKAAVAQRDATLAALRKDMRRDGALAAETAARSEHQAQQLQMDLRRALAAQDRQRADNDLLSARFSRIEAERDGLRQLLEQLTPRLREAAEHIRALSSADQGDAMAALEGEAGQDEKAGSS